MDTVARSAAHPGVMKLWFLILLRDRTIHGMNPVVLQLLTLSGVVLGSVGTFSVTTLTERAKWRRSQEVRWDDRLLNSYSEYANAVKNVAQIGFRLAGMRGYPGGSPSVDVGEASNALAEAEAIRAVKWENLLLLGSPATVSAARAWHQTTWKLSQIAAGKDVTNEEYLALYEELGRARDRFYVSARKDLGIVSGDLPPSGRVWVGLTHPARDIAPVHPAEDSPAPAPVQKG